MRNLFRNQDQLQCLFTDEGITFYGPKQEVFFPYGSIDTVKMSLLGILQVTCRATICSFAVAHPDRPKVKEMVKFAKTAMKTAPKSTPLTIDLTNVPESQRISPELPPEEQLRLYKALFIQGAISKEAYDAKKRLLKS